MYVFNTFSVKQNVMPPATLFRHRVTCITKREPESPLPLPFELPRNFPAVVMADLSSHMLSSKGKSKFIAAVAASIFRFKSYPTKEEYEHVGQQIIKKFPFLRSASGTGYVSNL